MPSEGPDQPKHLAAVVTTQSNAQADGTPPQLFVTPRSNEVCSWNSSPIACPNCLRADALVTVGEATFCAACGYSSEGSRGCT